MAENIKKPKTPSGVDMGRHIKAAQAKLKSDTAKGVFKSMPTPKEHAAKRASGYFNEAARKARTTTIAKPSIAKNAVRSNVSRIAAKVGIKLAGRVVIPLAVAADVVGTVGAVTEGIRAIKAGAEANRNKKYMKKHYGSVEAAAATRRRRQSK